MSLVIDVVFQGLEDGVEEFTSEGKTVIAPR